MQIIVLHHLREIVFCLQIKQLLNLETKEDVRY